VVGISCVTTPACGVGSEPITHDDVIRATGAAAGRIAALVAGMIERLPP
jgi:purine-nucleoside phosphorylase